MSKHFDNGGQAFPLPNPFLQAGATWLDLCAMVAMEGIVSKHGYGDGKRYDLLSADAYKIAQAMLAEKRRFEGGRK